MQQYSFGKLISINSVNEITIFEKTPKNTIVFLDVDNTLIMPCDLLFRHDKGNNPYRLLFDELKVAYQKGTIKKSLFEKTLGHFRLQRKIELIEKSWPTIIEQLKSQNTSVCALTHLQTGTFGLITSMEQWRFNELKNHGVLFSSLLSDYKTKQFNTHFNPQASYFNGIFITETISKENLIEQLLIRKFITKPKLIVFVDDRETLVVKMAEKLEQLKIPFLAFHYNAMHCIPGQADPKIATFQKKQLFEHFIWYSDEEAAKKI